MSSLMARVAGAALLLAAAAQAADRPNIVLIFADDLGYGDLGCYGGALVRTPALDALARGGVRCTSGYVTAPVCAPSRCGLLSGSYNQRFGMQWNDDRRKYVFGEHKLLPQALRAAGYVTGHIGKWNVPVEARACFDEVHELIDWEADYLPDAGGHYFGVNSTNEFASSKRQCLWGAERPGQEYLTDRIGRHAVEFVTKHARGGKPFFLYLAFNAVHTPLHAKLSSKALTTHLKPPLDFYAAMLASLDENVGRVLAALPENTLVVFSSDNGPAKAGAQVWPADVPKDLLLGSAGPLNGHKGTFYEGGFRVPFLVRWPGRLQAGGVYAQAVSTMDVYATFCAAAGAPVPQGTRLDGVDLLPFLSGEREGPPHEVLYWKNGEAGAVRQGDWKLLVSPWQPKLQLFNLAEDLGERSDRAAEQPERVAQMHRAWLTWGAALPPRAAPPAAKKPGAAAPAKQDRAALFATKDKNADGRLSRDEFLVNQVDAAEAKGRFVKWDTDQDGALSRDEFSRMGGGRK